VLLPDFAYKLFKNNFDPTPIQHLINNNFQEYQEEIEMNKNSSNTNRQLINNNDLNSISFFLFSQYDFFLFLNLFYIKSKVSPEKSHRDNKLKYENENDFPDSKNKFMNSKIPNLEMSEIKLK